MNEAKKYILCAEDKWNDHEWLKQKMELVDSGLQVITFGNGLELIQYLSSLKNDQYYPSCIILDINMPVWDGIRTLSVLKKEQDWKDIPVIMLATLTQRKDAELSLKMGANQFINKPVREEELRSVSEIFTTNSIRQPSRKIIVA
jgi:CheY-like chemotaxis protein